MMHVRLVRERSNLHDDKAVLVKTKSGETLGHLEKKVAIVLALIMDTLPETILKR